MRGHQFLSGRMVQTFNPMATTSIAGLFHTLHTTSIWTAVSTGNVSSSTRFPIVFPYFVAYPPSKHRIMQSEACTFLMTRPFMRSTCMYLPIVTSRMAKFLKTSLDVCYRTLRLYGLHTTMVARLSCTAFTALWLRGCLELGGHFFTSST